MFGFGKIKCSKCGTENSKNDKFCSACGSNLSNTVCSGCGAKIGQGDKFCPECGSSITPIPAEDRSQETSVPMEEKIKLWSRKPDDFARRFELVDIKGTFRKHVTVEQGTKAIFLQGGRFMGELIPGTYDAGGLLKQIGNLNFSEKATVIVVDGSDTRLDFKIGNLRTKEAFAAGVMGILSINIENPIMFFTNMMKSREYISVTDLTEFLVPEMTNIVQAKIKQYSFDDLYGNLELKSEIQQDFEYHMRTTLNRLGLKLIHLPYFDYDETYWKDKITGASAEANLAEKRFELVSRMRHSLTSDKMDELLDKHKFDTFIKEIDKDKLIQTHEMRDIRTALELSSLEKETSKRMILDRMEFEYRLAKEKDQALHQGELTQIDLDNQLKARRKQMQLEWEETLQDEKEALIAIGLKAKLMETKRADEIAIMNARQEIEEKKLKARSGATDEALISTIGEGGGGQAIGHLGELAKMKVAKGLTHEQILALQAEKSAAAAEALKAKYGAEKTEQLYRERMADHQKFQDTMVQMTDKNADRAERMAGKSMEQMGATAVTRGQAAVPTTTVVGGGFGGAPVVVGAQSAPVQEKKVVLCQSCNAENEVGAKFCTTCGGKL